MSALLEINGLTYISADDAARQAGLSRDYICQLARRGVLVGRMLAHAWYLEQESVTAFVNQRNLSSSRRQPGQNTGVR